MATVDEALKARLDAHAGLLALVGDRNYPGRVPQNPVYPCNSFHMIIETQAGHAMGVDPNVVETRFQVSSWATSYGSCRALAKQVKLALSRWRGTQGNGVVVQDTFFEGRTGPNWDPGVGAAGGWHTTTDVLVFHQE